MGASERHFDVADTVLSILRNNSSDPAFDIKPSDIRIEEYSRSKTPTAGILVTPLQESEGIGLNDKDDIRYPVQITRVYSRLHGADGFKRKSKFRVRIRELFHRRRIGAADCELITTVRPASLNIPREWQALNLDITAMTVMCLIREHREQ